MQTAVLKKESVNGRVNIKEAVVTLLAITALLVATTLVFYGLTEFSLSRLVPGLTYAAALTGLVQIRKAWKAGKTLRRAMQLAFSWSIVSLAISVIGDATIAYLLDNNINSLATW